VILPGNKLKGLVLAGGRSTRMGADKALLNWHGLPQRDHIAGLLGKFCTEVYISCRPEQIAEIEAAGHKAIVDNYGVTGPMEGILSAMRQYPGAAWLVVACDLPLVDEELLTQLIAERDTNGIATTFRSPFDGLPEPLITIWEPVAFDGLVKWAANGYKCPRKVLINEPGVKILEAIASEKLMNANTPEDAAAVRVLLAKKLLPND